MTFSIALVAALAAVDLISPHPQIAAIASPIANTASMIPRAVSMIATKPSNDIVSTLYTIRRSRRNKSKSRNTSPIW